jgi:predicted transcriptional regulator of viral defense system
VKVADQRIAELAAGRHGIVTRTELRNIGVGSDAVDYRVKAGYLRPLHRGVYQVGSIACPHARERAALLACGEGAALSHESAAGILHMRAPPPDAPVDVTVPAPQRCRIAGIRGHRTQELRADEVTRVGDLRLTTPARTILDLADILAPRELERTLAHAERTELLTKEELARFIERHATRRGSAALRALLGDPTGPVLTRSEAEERFLALVKRGQLERPETNVVVARFEVDFFGDSSGSWWRSTVLPSTRPVNGSSATDDATRSCPPAAST